MSKKLMGLGRGLDSLISMDNIQTSGSSAINEIELSQISPNPEQPRAWFDEESLEELASSIRELGIIQPLTLRKLGADQYQIISGERRYRAAKKAGLTTVPAYIRTANDSELTEMALIENIQREDLNAIEVALTFKKTHRPISAHTGAAVDAYRQETRHDSQLPASAQTAGRGAARSARPPR